MPARRSLSGLPSNWRNGDSEAPARASAPRSPLTAVRSQPSVFSAAVTAVSVARAATPAAAAPTTAALAKAVATTATAIAAVFPATGSGATLSRRGSGTAATGVATTSTAVTTTSTGVAATAAAITTATAARATGATTATPTTAGAGLGLVDAQRAAHQLSALQGLDGTVLTVVIRHLHEGEAAFAAGVALQGQRAVRHITEGSEQLGNILLLSTEGEISNKNAHRPKGPIRRKSSLLSLNR